MNFGRYGVGAFAPDAPPPWSPQWSSSRKTLVRSDCIHDHIVRLLDWTREYLFISGFAVRLFVDEQFTNSVCLFIYVYIKVTLFTNQTPVLNQT